MTKSDVLALLEKNRDARGDRGDGKRARPLGLHFEWADIGDRFVGREGNAPDDETDDAEDDENDAESPHGDTPGEMVARRSARGVPGAAG